jgi:hypothetical protein
MPGIDGIAEVVDGDDPVGMALSLCDMPGMEE